MVVEHSHLEPRNNKSECKELFTKLLSTTSLHLYRYNVDSVASFDAVITANHASAVDLACEDQPVTETESQEENIEFEGDNTSQIERGGGGVLRNDRTSSPTLSVVQYRLSLALVAQPNPDSLKEGSTQL